MSTKKIIIILSVIIVGLIFFSKFTGKSKKGTKVAVEKVVKRTIVEEVTASGTIYPESEVKISPDISGEIIDLLVKEGDTVQKGQLLVRINPDLYQTQLDQAKAGLNSAKANTANVQAQLNSAKSNLRMQEKLYERQKKLFQDKVISQQEFDNAENQYNVAVANLEGVEKQALSSLYNVQSVEANVQQSSKNYGRTSVYAPTEGVITGLVSKKGERVVGTAQMAGTEMMRISDLSKMEVRVDVNENDIVRIKLGDTAGIEVDAYQGKKFKGVVTQVANSAKNSLVQSATDQVTKFEVKVLILPESYEELMKENQGRLPFRPGMSASVHIYTKVENNVLAVPVTSVTMKEKSDNSGEKEEVVFLVVDNKIVKKAVKTSIQDIKYIKISEGIKEGETVVALPYEAINYQLKEGDLVQIVDKEALFVTDKK